MPPRRRRGQDLGDAVYGHLPDADRAMAAALRMRDAMRDFNASATTKTWC